LCLDSSLSTLGRQDKAVGTASEYQQVLEMKMSVIEQRNAVITANLEAREQRLKKMEEKYRLEDESRLESLSSEMNFVEKLTCRRTQLIYYIEEQERALNPQFEASLPSSLSLSESCLNQVGVDRQHVNSASSRFWTESGNGLPGKMISDNELLSDRTGHAMSTPTDILPSWRRQSSLDSLSEDLSNSVTRQLFKDSSSVRSSSAPPLSEDLSPNTDVIMRQQMRSPSPRLRHSTLSLISVPESIDEEMEDLPLSSRFSVSEHDIRQPSVAAESKSVTTAARQRRSFDATVLGTRVVVAPSTISNATSCTDRGYQSGSQHEAIANDGTSSSSCSSQSSNSDKTCSKESYSRVIVKRSNNKDSVVQRGSLPSSESSNVRERIILQKNQERLGIGGKVPKIVENDTKPQKGLSKTAEKPPRQESVLRKNKTVSVQVASVIAQNSLVKKTSFLRKNDSKLIKRQHSIDESASSAETKKEKLTRRAKLPNHSDKLSSDVPVQIFLPKNTTFSDAEAMASKQGTRAVEQRVTVDCENSSARCLEYHDVDKQTDGQNIRLCQMDSIDSVFTDDEIHFGTCPVDKSEPFVISSDAGKHEDSLKDEFTDDSLNGDDPSHSAFVVPSTDTQNTSASHSWPTAGLSRSDEINLSIDLSRIVETDQLRPIRAVISLQSADQARPMETGQSRRVESDSSLRYVDQSRAMEPSQSRQAKTDDDSFSDDSLLDYSTENLIASDITKTHLQQIVDTRTEFENCEKTVKRPFDPSDHYHHKAIRLTSSENCPTLSVRPTTSYMHADDYSCNGGVDDSAMNKSVVSAKMQFHRHGESYRPQNYS